MYLQIDRHHEKHLIDVTRNQIRAYLEKSEIKIGTLAIYTFRYNR